MATRSRKAPSTNGVKVAKGYPDKPTPAAEWNPTKLLKLPSGKTALVMELDLSVLIKLGKFPDFLTPNVEKIFTGNVNKVLEAIKERGIVDVMRNERQMLEEFARARFLSPKIVDDPDPEKDEISPNWLSIEDLQFVMSDIIRPADELMDFPSGQNSSVEPVGDVQQTEGEAE